VEGTLVPVFLQELLLPLRLIVPRLLCVLEVLLEPLLFGQRASALNLLALLLASDLVFLVALDSPQLAQPPRLELGFGVQAVRVVDVGYDVLFLLYMNIFEGQ
jgi:hypothetical protein